MSLIEELKVENLRIPLEIIKSATGNFAKENYIAGGGYGNVYKSKFMLSNRLTTVAIKQLVVRPFGQGKEEFVNEISLLSKYKHENLVSLVGFCDEDGQMILVYEYASHGSLDKHLKKAKDPLTWVQRIKICIGAACGLLYLHTGVGAQHRVIHRDIKSSNILLDQNWEAKVADFGLSRIGPANQAITFVVSKPAGTPGYCAPEYFKMDLLTKEADVYSFGVVLFEVLCGRLALDYQYEDEKRSLVELAQKCSAPEKLKLIVDPSICNQIAPDSLKAFSEIAYQCVRDNRKERPTMALILEKLELAFQIQVRHEREEEREIHGE